MHSSAWWQDFEFEDGVLTVKKTGARVRLEAGVVGDFLTWLPYYVTVESWRLAPGRKTGPAVYFAPDRPRPWYFVWPVIQAAGMRIVNSPEKADLAFVFDDSTTGRSPDLSATLPVVNGRCTSIEKSHVADVFQRVFGYSLAVDPATWTGRMVEKSETNGAHDGRIVQGPIEAKPGFVYQRVVDNRMSDGLVEDLRCPTVGGRIPVVMHKRRPVNERFANFNTDVAVSDPHGIFTPAELSKLSEFASGMGLDWGGMDVLRDRQDGRIYVVDVNKTDMGPPIALSLDDKIQVTRRMARALTDYTQRVLSGDQAPRRHNPD